MITAADETPNWPELHRGRGAIVVVGIVGSVGLLLRLKDEVTEQWRHFVYEPRWRRTVAAGLHLVPRLARCLRGAGCFTSTVEPGRRAEPAVGPVASAIA